MAYDEIVAQVPNMSVEELWRMFHMIFQEGNINRELHDSVKYGIEIRFDIRQYIRYQKGVDVPIYINAKNQWVKVNGKCILLTKFDDEIDTRKSIMVQIIMQTFSKSEDLLEARD